MPLTPFPRNQERLRELGELPPLRCVGLPLQGSPETTLREETFVHCTRTGKESVGDKLGAQSVRPSVLPPARASVLLSSHRPWGLSPRSARFVSPWLAVSLSLPSRCLPAPPSLPDLGSPS